MCLAVPMTITKIEGSRAVAESRGVETVVDISFIPDVKKGEKVIVHAGFIIERLDENEAAEIDKVWDLYLEQLDKEESTPGVTR
jgi:hydrogenase expression/formation protein HypC